jgi:predicted TIM-barrel fold metal-dependent hydrolase
MIWDLHCHLSGIEGRTPDERMARLIAYADRMGIARVCVYMGYPFSTNPTPGRLREENDQVLQALSHWHHRAFGFVYASAEHVEASLDEIERCVASGPMVGVKLWVAGKCSDRRVDPIVHRAQELDAIIFQHTWFKTDGSQLPGESTPLDLAVLARRHSEAKLICGHTGGTWELGIRAVRDVPNVWVDLAGSDPTAGFTEMAVGELGPTRVLYGSDAPGRSFASQLAKVQGARIAADARRLILGENLRALLGPILKRKGIQA